MPPVPAAPRRRGRPPKARLEPEAPASEARASAAGSGPADATRSQPEPEPEPEPVPRRRGRPPKARSGPERAVGPEAAAEAGVRPEPSEGVDVAGSTAVAEGGASAGVRRRRASGGRSTASAPGALTVEMIAAVVSPREFRLHPRERTVAFTAEAAGARQLFTMPIRGDAPTQVTASEKPVSDPQWSPDGRRLVFLRDGALWVVEMDGSRQTLVTEHPAGNSFPRWSPDGRRVAFLSRRRGWSQVWVIDAPVPRRGRPPREPRAPEPVPLTRPGVDVDAFAWSPDGASIVVGSQREDDRPTGQIHVVDVATGEEHQVSDPGALETSPTWGRDGSLLFVSDADGWFQVVRLSPDLRERRVVTAGAREHGEPTGAPGQAPLASPDGSRFAYVEIHDGLCDLMVGPLGPAVPAKRGPGRPPKHPRPLSAARPGTKLSPWDGIWRIVDWMPDGTAILAIGEGPGRPQDLWVLPVPGVAAPRARPRQVTRSLPIVLEAALGRSAIPGERVAVTARDGLRLEGTLWRPPEATGRRGAARVPAIVYLHGGPTSQALLRFDPFRQLLVREGFAVLDIDFRGSTGYGRAFRLANRDEWGHADVQDIVDAANWLLAQPWCDGRLAAWGGSYGGYLVLGALVEEPELWRAGVDLFGDSEIAESFRHGDRLGRLELQRQMGSPDDPDRESTYRRGSPVYRADRIQAPLLIFHGRRDKRVVPLMTERMVEALEIEGKHHEVVWYDDEGHGWERRETRRDYYARVLAFLRRHVLDERGPSR
jgi:dipeptidyl aminopeptidase/acylaminoacyl peptidase